MPVCVHCARPVSSLLVTFGADHVVPARCGYDGQRTGCGRVADPYVEHDVAVLVIDVVRDRLMQLLGNVHAFRHILYNTAVDLGSGAATPTSQARRGWRHVRHFWAMVLVESCMSQSHQISTGFMFVCVRANAGVHPYKASGRTLWTPRHDALLWPSAAWLAPAWHGGVRLVMTTCVDLAVLHAVVVLGVYVLTPRAERVAWYTPSVALLLSNVGTVLLLSSGLVWNSRISPEITHASAFVTSAWSARFPALALPVQDWNTEWMIRHVLGGTSAGVALRGTWSTNAAVLPHHRWSAPLLLGIGLVGQAMVRAWLHVPSAAEASAILRQGTWEQQHVIDTYCQRG